jgi:hypothetical protein
MNTIIIEDWFKTTISGIIVLGAVGSIVAVAFLKLLSLLLYKYLPLGIRAYLGLSYRRGFRHGFFIGVADSSINAVQMATYLVFHLAGLVIGLSIVLVLSYLLGVVFIWQPIVELIQLTFLLSFLICLGVIFCYSQFRYLHGAYACVVAPILTKADEVRELEKGAPNRKVMPKTMTESSKRVTNSQRPHSTN